MKRIYKLSELQKLPTLAVGQVDDLKIDTGNRRVWLSRLSKEDGEPYDNKVTVEKLLGNRYIPATRTDYRSGGKHGRWENSRWVNDYTYQAV